MTESHPITRTARIAAKLLHERFQRDLADLAAATVADLGGVDGPDWHVDFNAGTATREFADPPTVDRVETPNPATP